jgi:ATP-dependent protease ClpP protease subunit
MNFFFHILLLANLISHNNAFYVNNLILSRRVLLNYASLSQPFLSENIKMQNDNNSKIDSDNNYNFFINKKLNKKDFENYHQSKTLLQSKSNIYFNGELNDESCFKLTEALMHHKNNLMTNSEHGNHINLYIQSPGGALLPTLAVVDEILRSEIPVYTYIRGYAASASTLISVAGHHRIMYNHSLMMIHSVRTHQEVNTYNEVKDIYENLDLFMKIVKDIYLENTNIDKKLLDELLLKDSWITSSRALELGLVDQII